MDLTLAKSLLLPGKTTLSCKHDTIWFQNIASGIEEPHRSIDIHRKYIHETGHAVSIVLAMACQSRDENGKINNKAVNVYGAFSDVTHLVENIQGADHLFECLLGENPRFYYQDLEWKLDDSDEPKVVIADNIRFISDYVLEIYGIQLDLAGIQISVADGLNTSSSTWHGIRKGSAHVKYPFIFRNNDACAAFSKEVLRSMKGATNRRNLEYTKNGILHTVMDPSVYKKSQNFRMLYCSKFGENRPLVPFHSSEKLTDHLVGVYDLATYDKYPIIQDVKRTTGEADLGGKLATTNKPSKAIERICPSAFDHNKVSMDELEEVLNCLAPERLDNYETWMQILWAIYNVCHVSGYPTEVERLMHQYSRKNEKYVCQEVQNIHSCTTYKSNGLHMGSLMEWVREDSPERFKFITRKYSKDRLFRQAAKNNLYLEPEKLSSCFEILKYCDPFVRDYDLDEYAGVAVVSGLGTGKTTQLAKFVTSAKFPRIIVFSNRNLFGVDIMKTLNGIVQLHYGYECTPEKMFRSHLDFANQLFPSDVSRLVIQMESVHKLKGYQFDLVILDESEAALTQLSAPTMTNLRGSAEEFFRICTEASKFIVCDGFMTNRTTNFIEQVLKGTDKKCLLHINEHLVVDKEAFQVSSVKELTGVLIKVLNCGQRPAMFTASKRQGAEIVEAVKNHFKDRVRVQFYNADADDEKMLEDMRNVDQSWIRVAFLIFSPVITNGVNFTAEHFDCMFLLGTASSCCVSQVMQAARRVRKLAQKRLYFYVNPMFFGPGDLSWKHEKVEADMKNNSNTISEYFELEKRHMMSTRDMQTKMLEGFVEKAIDEHWNPDEISSRLECLKATFDRLKKCQVIPSWLWDVLVRNRIEVNLSRSMYEELFKDYLKRIGVGRICQYDVDQHDVHVNAETIFTGDDEAQDQMILKYADIRKISMEEADKHMTKQRCKKALYVQKRELKRWYFDNYQVLNRDAPMEIRQQVFDAIDEDLKKENMYDLVLKEHSETVGSLVERMEIKGNPFLSTYPLHVKLIPAMHRLCKMLSLKSSFDFETAFTSVRIVEQSEALSKVLDELYTGLGIRIRMKESGKEVTAFEILRKRLGAVFKSWNKSKLTSNVHRIRSGDRKGERVHTYRLSNNDPFSLKAKALLVCKGGSGG